MKRLVSIAARLSRRRSDLIQTDITVVLVATGVVADGGASRTRPAPAAPRVAPVAPSVTTGAGSRAGSTPGQAARSAEGRQAGRRRPFWGGAAGPGPRRARPLAGPGPRGPASRAGTSRARCAPRNCPVSSPALGRLEGVLCDQGLQSPRLWTAIRRQGWHPYMRYDRHITFQATTGPRWPARCFVARAGPYTVAAGRAFRQRKRRCTLIVLWVPGQETPWGVLMDELPDDVDLGAYGLRVWIEQGFRTLKRMGWQCQRTRRMDSARVDRHWLVLAVATLWGLAHGTRVEEARLCGLAPGCVRRPPLSVFQLGRCQAQRLLHRGYAWARVWLRFPCRDRTRPGDCNGWPRRPGSPLFAQRCGWGLYLPLPDESPQGQRVNVMATLVAFLQHALPPDRNVPRVVSWTTPLSTAG